MTSRVGVVGMWHETNTYSSRPATESEFEAFELLEGDDIFVRHLDTESVIGGFLAGSDVELVPLFSAGAWPCGPAPAETAVAMLGRLGVRLEAAGPLDGVLVNLHGAMVAVGHPDMEAETLRTIRRHHPDAATAVVVDFHANPSHKFVDLADVVISYDTYPHVDMFQRGVEAAGWLRRLLDGEPLKTRLGKHPLLVVPLAQNTDKQPMAGLYDVARRAAARFAVERVCITGGFAYADVDRAGISVLVTDRADRQVDCTRVIDRVIRHLDQVASEFDVSLPSPKEAVMQARLLEKPVVLADVADNVGGGASGDSTAILSAIIEAGITGALAVVVDPEIAHRAHALGAGARLAGHLGGKTDHLHGPPIEFDGEIVALSDGRYTSHGSWSAGLDVDQGRTAWLKVCGNDVVVAEYPRPPFHIEQVTHIGVDPGAATMIVAKGAVAWRSAYGDLAGSVIEVDGPGACPVDLQRLPRRNMPERTP